MILNGKKKVFIKLAIISLIIAFIVEFLNLSYRSSYELQGNGVDIFFSSEDTIKTYNYAYENGRFSVTGNDPHVVFESINTNVESILLSFSTTLSLNTPINIYYTTNEEENFNETLTISGIIPANSNEFYVDCPNIYIHSIRFDIEGNFSLDRIIISDMDMTVVKSSENFSVFRTFIVFSIIMVISSIFYFWYSTPQTAFKLTYFELIYCIFCGIFYFIWSITKPFNYAPDEYMRYEVSRFIFDNNRLPVNTETICYPWGFSYAHYPTILCSILSYIPMKFVGMFTDDNTSILLAARFVSVIGGTLTVYFVIKLSKLLFKKPINWIMVIIVSMLPQFVFICSYVNNDILTMLGASIILYAWCKMYINEMNLNTAITLAIGIVICALSYYNSYGWIILSIVYFLLYYLFRKKEQRKFIRYSLTISGIVLTCISFFFIRHLYIYKDLLGFKTIDYFAEIYASEGCTPSIKAVNSIKGLGFSIVDMLFTKKISSETWVDMSYRSFIEYFGYMNVPGNTYVYFAYSLLFCISFIAIVIHLIFLFRDSKTFSDILNLQKIFFYTCIVLSAVIPLSLSVVYSYSKDYQPQGRYFITALLGIALLTTTAVNFAVSKVKNSDVRDVIIYSLCISFTMITVNEFFVTYLP